MITYEHLHARYKTLRDEEVAEVVRKAGDYTEEAVAAARAVLSERGIDPESLKNTVAERIAVTPATRQLTDLDWVAVGMLSLLIPFIEFFWVVNPKGHPSIRRFARIILKIRLAFLGLLVVLLVVTFVLDR